MAAIARKVDALKSIVNAFRKESNVMSYACAVAVRTVVRQRSKRKLALGNAKEKARRILAKEAL